MAVKETKEALNALVTLVAEFKRLAKDGIQLADFVAVVDKYNTDAAFRKIVDDGIAGAELISKELSSLNLFDGFELLRYVPELMKKFEKV